MNFHIKRALLALSIVSTTVFPFVAHAEGGANGGGGGVVMVNGQLKLLTENGMQVSRALEQGEELPAYYSVKPATVEALKGILNLLETEPGHKAQALKYILGDGTTLIAAQSISNKLESEIRSLYDHVAKSAGAELKQESFILAAYTARENKPWNASVKTYILPTFESLTPLQQAKVLIHEFTYRALKTRTGMTFGEELQAVLSIDTKIEAVLRAKQQGLFYDQFELSRELSEVGLSAYSLKVIKYLAYRKLQRVKGSPLLLADLTDDLQVAEHHRSQNRFGWWGYNPTYFDKINLNPIKIQNITRNNQILRKYFSGSEELSFNETLISFPNKDKIREQLYDRNQHKKYDKIREQVRLQMIANVCAATPTYANQNIDFINLDPQTFRVRVVNCAAKSILELDGILAN